MKKLTTQVLKSRKGQTCILRLPLNVEEDELDYSLRISQSIETINEISRFCKIIILGHRGRPNLNRVRDKSYRKKFSLKDTVEYISKKTGKKIVFIESLDFGKIKREIEKSNFRIFALENLRFSYSEKGNSEKLAKKIASLGDFYVNDAFSVAHRSNMSVDSLPRMMQSYAGKHFVKEVEFLSKVLSGPKRPFTLILGGAKVSDKIAVIRKLYKVADNILIGGVLATTFFAAKGIPIGESLYDVNSLDLARDFLGGRKIALPTDLVFNGRSICDVGSKTAEEFSSIIKNSKTIVWNGPMGLMEDDRYKFGTEVVAKSVSSSRVFSVVGGGETVSFIIKNELLDKISFASAGGGAMLKFLAGEKMPAIEALEYSSKNNF